MDYKDPITNPNYEGGRAKVSLRPFCPAPSVKKQKEKKKLIIGTALLISKNLIVL